MCFGSFRRQAIKREVKHLYQRAIDENWSAQEFMNEREKILNFYGRRGSY